MSLSGLRFRHIEALSTPWFLAPASRCSAPVTMVGLISFIPRIPAFKQEKSFRSGRFNKGPTFSLESFSISLVTAQFFTSKMRHRIDQE